MPPLHRHFRLCGSRLSEGGARVTSSLAADHPPQSARSRSAVGATASRRPKARRYGNRRLPSARPGFPPCSPRPPRNREDRGHRRHSSTRPSPESPCMSWRSPRSFQARPLRRRVEDSPRRVNPRPAGAAVLVRDRARFPFACPGTAGACQPAQAPLGAGNAGGTPALPGTDARRQSASNRPAAPMPPPMRMVTTTFFAPRRLAPDRRADGPPRARQAGDGRPSTG